MDFAAFWEFFQKILWPALLGYAVFLHNQIDKLRNSQHDFETDTVKHYATNENMRQLEDKLTAVLVRIDDKVTRILERNNG